MTEREVLESIRTRLEESFEIRRMVLFGSRAKGVADADSDWDVLIIAESSLPFVERQGAAMVALGPHSYPVDLLVYTPEEHSKAAATLGSSVYWAELEGREVYAV
ncbi:MAG TPA: nucleotidyltransferase domain-containing protein [Fimbriimonas sp.]|nr:nucleotidyltransferase domain-containing protein [Fimbriimonas sp.]